MRAYKPTNVYIIIHTTKYDCEISAYLCSFVVGEYVGNGRVQRGRKSSNGVVGERYDSKG